MSRKVELKYNVSFKSLGGNIYFAGDEDSLGGRWDDIEARATLFDSKDKALNFISHQSEEGVYSIGEMYVIKNAKEV